MKSERAKDTIDLSPRVFSVTVATAGCDNFVQRVEACDKQAGRAMLRSSDRIEKLHSCRQQVWLHVTELDVRALQGKLRPPQDDECRYLDLSELDGGEHQLPCGSAQTTQWPREASLCKNAHGVCLCTYLCQRLRLTLKQVQRYVGQNKDNGQVGNFCRHDTSG